jgi:hypothetical protein
MLAHALAIEGRQELAGSNYWMAKVLQSGSSHDGFALM